MQRVFPMKTIQLFAAALLLVAMSHRVSADDGQSVHGTGKGTVAIELDQTEWLTTQAITGKLIFQLTEVRDRLGRDLDAARLNGPKLNIIFPDEMAAVLPQVKWRTVFFPTVKVGHRYELAFSIRADEGFETLVKKGNADLVTFKPGTYKLSAMVDSPVRPPWDPPSKSPFVELHQQFTSTDSKTITITETRSGRVVGNDEVKKAMNEAEGDLKHQIVTFYAKRNVLSREDLRSAIDDAQGKAKADLASLYLSLKYPAKDLSFFTPVSEPVKLKGHDDPPIYVLLRPQQRMRFVCDLGTVHHMRVAHLSTVLAAKREVDFDAPRGEGVYEMYDDTHKKTWGWVLVHADKQAIAAAGLRPDTNELSAKVVEALIKQDAKSLEALSAPGFRVEDAIKKVRFQLADGDVRYHESTGTSNKVKTRMKINMAPKGQQPVFARELWLDFVRVGEELRLTNAAVWDVER